MAGFFDFIKNKGSNATTNGVSSQTVTSQTIQSQPVSYNGIGAPPTPSPVVVNETVTTTQSNPPQPAANNGTASSPPAGGSMSDPRIKSDSGRTPSPPDSAGQSFARMTDKPSASQPVPSHQQPVTNLDLMTHLTQRSNRVMMAATTKAKELKGDYIDSEHLLYGLTTDTEIYNLFVEIKIQPQLIADELNKIYKKGTVDRPIQVSPRLKRIIDNALIIARKLGFEFIAPEHLLLALYEEGEGAGARILAKLGVRKEELNKKITGKKEDLSEQEKRLASKKQAFEEYTIDLTAKAAQGLLDPVVERSPVIERVIHILSRRTKNNPSLVGEAGVGKTAIVEGLAQKIVSKEVPEPLLKKKLLQLDLMNILAGASHRGEFEERMKDLIEQIKNSQGQIILFIDEIHNIVGAGASGEGALDVSNFLKPALARGELQLIGATTLTEYRKYIEKDPALERRFQPVLVPEPTEEQAIKMLTAIKDKYEAFHRVKIPADVIEAAVKLSKRYVGDRFLPDKAVDLIDEAASAVRLPLISLPEEIKSFEMRVAELKQELSEADKKGDQVKSRILRSKIDDRESQLKEKRDEYNLKKGQTTTSVNPETIRDIISRWTGIPVSKITSSEVERLAHLEDIIHKRLINQNIAVALVSQAVRRGRAGLKSAARPIGSFVFLGPTGVGKTELAKTLADVLFGSEDLMIRFDMTEYMEKHEVAKLLGAPPGYVGYEEGGKLTEAVRRKPYSVVLFDEIEKAHPDIFNILLQILDDGRLTDNKGHVISFKNTVVICTSNIGTKMIQEEMMKQSNKQETSYKKQTNPKSEDVQKEKKQKEIKAEETKKEEKTTMIKGSPVAGDTKGDRKDPSVILGSDETKSQGTTPESNKEDSGQARMTNTNQDQKEAQQTNGVKKNQNSNEKKHEEKEDENFAMIKEKVMAELLKFFRPELVNRFDEVTIFEPLNYQHMSEIVKLQLKTVTKLLEDQEIGFYFNDQVIELIAQSGYDPIYGARPLKRAIQRLIENPISNLIIEGKIKPGEIIRVKVQKDELVFEVEKVLATVKPTKKYQCLNCSHRFENEIVLNSTTVCPKCLAYGENVKIEDDVKKQSLEKNKKEPQKITNQPKVLPVKPA